jgi:CheY-like chemotaxis protein
MGSCQSILIIDDDEEIQTILRAILESEGYDVVAARSGCEALELLRSRMDVSLVLLDFRLPDMSGLDLASNLEKEARDLAPIVLLSADSGLKALQFPPSVVGVVKKPFELDELLGAVKRFRRPCEYPEVS